MSETTQTRLAIVLLLAIIAAGTTIAAIGANAARSAAPAAPVEVIQPPAPAPAPAPPLTPGDIIRDATGETGIHWVLTDDPALNCAPEGRGGCFNPTYPDAIILTPGMDDQAQRYVVLHELAHLHQYRDGLPLDECAADAQALAWGAAPDQLYYAPNC